MTVRPRQLASRLLRAAMVGVATVLVPKADPRAHWSTPAMTVVDPAVTPGSERSET